MHHCAMLLEPPQLASPPLSLQLAPSLHLLAPGTPPWPRLDADQSAPLPNQPSVSSGADNKQQPRGRVKPPVRRQRRAQDAPTPVTRLLAGIMAALQALKQSNYTPRGIYTASIYSRRPHVHSLPLITEPILEAWAPSHCLFRPTSTQ